MSIDAKLLEGFKDLYCPVKFSPMIEAYSLVPCMHKVSKAALEGIKHGNEQNTFKCPICRTIGPAFPDPWTSGIVKTLLGIGDKELPEVCAKLAEEENKEQEELPYPGKKAKLEAEVGWELLKDSGADLVRQIILKSATPGSFLGKMRVLGYRDGSVSIFAEFHLNEIEAKLMEAYFSSFGLDTFYFSVFKSITVIAKTKSELASLFNLIATNNEIPEECFSLTRDLVKSGDWKKVTPVEERRL